MARHVATLSVEEAGAVLGLSRAAAYRAARAGDLPAIRVNGRMLVPKIRLARMLEGEPRRQPRKRSHASALRLAEVLFDLEAELARERNELVYAGAETASVYAATEEVA